MSIITLANGTCFEADSERTLLDNASASGITLEHSCRNGRCGVCKARVRFGETRPAVEELSLSDTERDEGFILTCCRSAVDDVSLDVSDLGLLAGLETKTLPCRIDEIKQLAPDVLGIILRTPPGQSLQYRAGQHISVIGKGGVRRSYSLANAPRQDGKLELHVRQVADGEMSRYWFEEAGKDDLLRLEGPFGTFCSRPAPRKQPVFLATGTGIAPIKAMLEELGGKDSDHGAGAARVYWGNRYSQDLYWQPENTHSGVVFFPVLSRPADSWSGHTGYVQDVLCAHAMDWAQCTVYACGSPQMIAAAREKLLGAGLAEADFHSDAFVSTA